MFCENVVRDLSIFASSFKYRINEKTPENYSYCFTECSVMLRSDLVFYPQQHSAPLRGECRQGGHLRSFVVGLAVCQLLSAISEIVS